MSVLLRSVAALPFVAALAACAPGEPDVEAEEAAQTEDALGTAKITFGGDFSETVSGKLRAGDKIEIAYDTSRLPTCRGEQNGIPQWAITAYWRVGSGELHMVALAGLTNGQEPFIVPDAKGTLEVWFEVTNRWGCHEYDSDFGQNYKFKVAAPLGEPDWAGNAASVINRATCSGGPCDENRNILDSGFVFDTWARQRATIAGLYFDVWEEGVTDFDNPDLWKQVDAQMHYRFAGQSAFSTRYVDFFSRVGNDARYQVLLRTLDPFYAMPSVVPVEQCPQAELELSADGFYVTTTVEIYFTADTVDVRPENAETFVGRFEDYAAPYAACL
jgi:hypothetical protein